MPGPKTETILATLPPLGPAPGDPGYLPYWDELEIHNPRLDIEREPITMRQWMMLFECEEYRRVAFTDTGLYHVSTVWLGLDHGGGRIFETMVFSNDVTIRRVESEGKRFETRSHPEKEQWRYRTLAEALEGHAELVAQARAMEAVMATIDPRDE